MKYIGRILASLPFVCITLGFSWRYYSSDKSLEIFLNASVGLISIVIAWFLGKQFDKAIFLNKELVRKNDALANYDALTGLPNRYHFTARFQSEVSGGTLRNAAVLYLDLDRFKVINDTFGHHLGDDLLKKVARRIKDSIRNEDALARHGGDEFIIYLLGADQDEAAATAQYILNRINEPYFIDQYEMFLTSSIGICFYPEDGEDIGELITKADTALHQAKRAGKNCFRFFNHFQSEESIQLLGLENDLRKALERDEFFVVYQPQLNMRWGKINGVEALIRWKHPEKGLISPAKFIPIAEETGLIIPIGEWVLRKACFQNKAWQTSGLPPAVVSVNLSLRQFYQPNLIRMIRQVLEDTGLASEYLELEITESMMIDPHHALAIFQELKKLGIKISLDDFGTGYSSLHYLKAMPVDKLKIDQSFIRDCLTDVSNATIVKAIIAMAHQLKLEVVAEGVETKEQLIFLQQNLCNEAQGYLFSKPLPVEEFEEKRDGIERIMAQFGIPQEQRDRNWMEEALREAQRDLRETVRQQQGITFKFKEQNGKFVHTLCDGEFLYRLGYAPELIVGRTLHEILPASVADRALPYYRRAWEGERTLTCEGDFNGYHFMFSLRPIIRGGQVVEVIGSCVDISERKKAEELLRKSEKLTVIGQLAAGVAHEIRNPLTSIKGFVQLLQRDMDKPRYMDIMLSEIDSLEQIIQEFLAFANPQPPEMKLMDSSLLLQQVVTLMNSQAIINNVQIVQEHESELSMIYCDGNRIKQVFINILKNAVEAMPNGGVVRIQVMAPEGDRSRILFRFTDQGGGITEKRLQRIGEPYYDTKEKGMGLGLMISQKIVQEHKGTLSIRNILDKGCEVDVVLPLPQGA